ncbi:MAG TPA: 4-hydroxy-tetrahydrodipicolinate synthase, partial [Nordella sp.]|nr:4-hydroxy-tetrahydrodipicolinate synthase [Nordella sp.]
MTLEGLWIPLITPFRDGDLDETSLRRLVHHYAAQPVDGLILGATTGEGLSLTDEELDRLVLVARSALAEAKRQMQVFLGVSGGATVKVVKALHRTQMLPVDGYLITCPYYTRPSQQGLFQHFTQLADNTQRPIIIYNIPYRTGVNLGNETMLRLAKHPNIIGVKDCAADATQSFDLLRLKPEGFSVLTGEGDLFYTALVHGAEGGILASAHVETAAYALVQDRLRQGDQRGALAAWHELVETARLLFQEPNPAPVKHWLWRTGLIDSPE